MYKDDNSRLKYDDVEWNNILANVPDIKSKLEVLVIREHQTGLAFGSGERPCQTVDELVAKWKRWLEEIAHRFESGRILMQEGSLSPGEVKSLAVNVSKQATKLAKMLDEWHSWQDSIPGVYEDRDLLTDDELALRGIIPEVLKRVPKITSTYVEAINPFGNRRNDNAATHRLNALVDEVISSWEWVGGELKFSRDSQGIESGPLVRYVEMATKPILEACKSVIPQKELTLTPSKIRARIEMERRSKEPG